MALRKLARTRVLSQETKKKIKRAVDEVNKEAMQYAILTTAFRHPEVTARGSHPAHKWRQTACRTIRDDRELGGRRPAYSSSAHRNSVLPAAAASTSFFTSLDSSCAARSITRIRSRRSVGLVWGTASILRASATCARRVWICASIRWRSTTPLIPTFCRQTRAPFCEQHHRFVDHIVNSLWDARR